MDWPIFDFTVACLMMGLGIGTDVAIATALRHQHLHQISTIVFWVVGVSLTHTLFPMMGYILTYFSIQTMPIVTPVVGLIAFYCIARFLWQELKDMTANETSVGDDRQVLVTLGLILAVSWDALWSGPAKSAQVIGWPELLVWLSFIIVGVLVALTAISTLYLSRRLKMKFTLRDNRSLKSCALWLQYSIVGYFGLLALLRYTLQFSIAWWQILSISALVILICMEYIQFYKKRGRVRTV